MNERRPIPGFEGYYVTTEGRVWSERARRAGCWLKPVPHERTGHLRVDLYDAEGRRRPRKIHTLVAEVFIGPRPDGLLVLHVNGDPADNRLGNLRYGSHSDNSRDAVAHGVHPQARKTHCPHGHPYTPENTYRNPKGSRECRTCLRSRKRARRER